MFGSYFTDIDFPLVFEPQLQVSLVSGYGDGRQPFSALVLHESSDGFVGFQALGSLVHEKSSFLGGYQNQKPPGLPVKHSLAIHV
jgi:hypothetical protein